MYIVYILVSQNKKDKFYIGWTNNLNRRLHEHNIGKTYTTQWHQPYRIVYYEAYLDKQDALERERKLKHHGVLSGI